MIIAFRDKKKVAKQKTLLKLLQNEQVFDDVKPRDCEPMMSREFVVE